MKSLYKVLLTLGALVFSTLGQAAPDLYRIGPGDVIRITVYQSPDLSLETRISENGAISYPLLGQVTLGGMTVSAAEAHLAEALRKGELVKNPQVMMAVVLVRANQEIGRASCRERV